MATITTAQRIIDSLDAYGVEFAFGIPGVHTLPLYDALQRSRVKHVLARHEQGAAFMADGYARATGRYAVCILVSGAGAMNAATGIGQAYSDSIPMLVITTVNGTDRLGLKRGELHEMRDQRMSLLGLTDVVCTLM